MTKEEIKERLPIMRAFAEGKTIQVRINNDSSWTDLLDDKLEISNLYEYRIKSDPKYRPFKTQEECWKEMLKHQPFAFLSSANEYDWFSICRVFEEEGIPKITFASNPYSDYDMAKVFDTFQFADGTPFGIKEE